MRLLKGFIIVLAGLFIFITVISLFIPSTVLVTRGVEINAKAGPVFSAISNLQNWKHWHPVFMNDTGRIHFDTDAQGISNSCAWDSKGKTNNMLVTGNRNQVLTLLLTRAGDAGTLNTIKVLPLADSSRVQVEWSAQTKLKWYPWEKFYGIFIEKISGQGYEDALNSLKTYTENH